MHTYDHSGAMTVYVCNTTRITHWTCWDQYSDNRILDLWPVRFDSALNSLGQHPLYDMQNERSERIWYSVQSEKSVYYTYTYIRMSYCQRSIQNAIQKIKINEVFDNQVSKTVNMWRNILIRRDHAADEIISIRMCTWITRDELIWVSFLYNNFYIFLL